MRILLLTAIEEEYLQAKSYLKNIREIKEENTPFDEGEYQIDDKKITIVLSRTGKGTQKAGIILTKALRIKPKPDYVFFVGIAGGIKDLKIGDVIVADKFYYGEIGKDGEKFYARPEAGYSEYKLVESARIESRKDDWKKFCKQNNDNSNNVIIGVVCTFEKVVANNDPDISFTYNLITEHYNDSQAVDMESGGMIASSRINSVSNLVVIRGISDMLVNKDKSNSDGSRQAALNTAFGFAFCLIKKIYDSDKPRTCCIISFNADEKILEEPELGKIISYLRKISRDDSLTFKFHSKGSINLYLDCTYEAYKKLEMLFENNNLNAIEGFKVLNVKEDIIKERKETIWYPEKMWQNQNTNFVGRVAELKQISEQLKMGLITAITEASNFASKRMAALIGTGGIGKTKTVIRYALRNADNYEYIFFIHADTPGNIMNDYAKIAGQLKISQGEENVEILAQILIKWMNKNTGWLLIMDNVDNAEQVDTYLPRNNKGHILVTSRLRILDELASGNAKLIPIGLLNREESRELIIKSIGRTEKLNADEEIALRELISLMGGLPVALEQAAAYIRRVHYSFANYLQAFNSQRTELFVNNPHSGLQDHEGLVFHGKKEDSDEKDNNEKQIITTTFHVSFNHIVNEAQKYPGKPESAAPDLLLVSAFLSPDNIPMKLLTDGADELGTTVATALRGDRIGRINEALQLLYKYSLIDINMDNTYNMHRLIQEVVRRWWIIDKEQRILWAKRVIGLLRRGTRIFSANLGTFTDSLEDQRYASFVANILMDDWKQEDFEFQEAADLLSQTGFLLTRMKQFKEAEPFLKRALEIRKKQIDQNPLNVAETLSHLGNMLADKGKNSEALPYYNEAMEIRKSVQGENHPDVAQIHNDFGIAYFNLYEYDKAEKHYQEAKKIWEMGGDETLIGAAFFNLAMIYKNQSNKKKKAEEYFKEAVQKIRTLYMKAIASTEYGEFLVSLGRYNEALPLLQKGWELANKCYPEMSNLKLKHLNALASVLRYLGLQDELRKIDGEIKKIRKS